MDQQGNKLRGLLGNSCITEGNRKEEELLGELLREKQLTLATAESCTGGYVAHLITSLPGASSWYMGSVIAYNNSIKEKLLLVKHETLAKHGAVSREVAEQMVRGVAAATGTNCAIAVTGIMGPEGGTKEKPVGTVWVATLCREEIITRKYNVGNNRAQNIERTAGIAILQLLRMVQEDSLS
jgi:nicotinamide-nucleotide amidase